MEEEKQKYIQYLITKKDTEVFEELIDLISKIDVENERNKDKRIVSIKIKELLLYKEYIVEYLMSKGYLK